MRFLSLQSLPVELLLEIQTYALSEFLPITSKHLHDVFNQSSSSFRAQYIAGRCDHPNFSTLISSALCYPLCTKQVLEAILRSREPCAGALDPPVLPRRFFRSLTPKSPTNSAGREIQWSKRDAPLPFLEFLYNTPHLPPPNSNSHDGYPLTKAVHAGFIPLVRFLLEHGASPRHKDGLAVTVAIRRRDLSLVKMLVERGGSSNASGEKCSGKKRRLEDRVELSSEMLRVAVKCDARDIVEYLRGKGCVPDMKTLRLMMH
ncbi:hypothetical protein JAAARDRAFT_58482 [Jaapia argillacea MUCL 33604]|uniref:Uncharacterized protein n=1 Tax=Jaapia argillacea MUCL 33604 TaxID=933084 RepID=A0A067Q339_9AGAM|nr:hypothetical protein JAAARDRAFT_58482 [Jaapia argillacea MUCL 33604]